MPRNPSRYFNAQSWAYLWYSLLHYADANKWTCSCGTNDYHVVARKGVATALVRCNRCRLLYRAPRDRDDQALAFYQLAYTSGGLTTSLPDQSSLGACSKLHSLGSDKDFADRIAVLLALGVAPGSKVLDYGASWGYATYQMREAGYDTGRGFEIRKPRAAYGEANLQIRIATDEKELDANYDVVFSSHVLEHLNDPRDAFFTAARILKRGGVFVAFTPNGSLVRLRQDPRITTSTGEGFIQCILMSSST